ncbi:replication-associated recombination protein A [Myxococcota bacterium]
MRPRSLEEVVGQPHLLGGGRFLREVIAQDRLPSLMLWGPPGSGKTTLACVVSLVTKAEFVIFSAVLGGVAPLRELIQEARDRRAYQGRSTLMLVDEIHHFNRSQQDAFLPHLEDGSITLIGATTENPSFSVNAALLSRCRVLRLHALDENDLVLLLRRALADRERGLGGLQIEGDDEALRAIARTADGDARRALGLLEAAAALLGEPNNGHPRPLTCSLVEQAAEDRTLLYDRAGEEHYNVVSALIKSMRGSDPHAAVYWLMRILDAGDDPRFVLRRLIIFASEDIGNADPRALGLAINADQAYHRLGMPEGIYAIVHACLYLASCPKSNSVGRAFGRARELIARHGALPVPLWLRNPVSSLMREEGYGQGYRSPHDRPDGFVPEAQYLPDQVADAQLYEPTTQGLEKAIGERLARLRSNRNGQG